MDGEVHRHDNFLLVRSLDWGVFMVVPTTAEWFQARQDVQILSQFHALHCIVYILLTIDRYNLPHCPSDSFLLFRFIEGKN